MTDTPLLPAGFEDLAPLARQWARPTENGRSGIRWSASPEAFAAFYAAFMPRLIAVLDRLAACPLDSMSEEERNLFYLASAFAAPAPHHELYGGSAEVPHSFAAARFVPGHGEVPSERLTP